MKKYVRLYNLLSFRLFLLIFLMLTVLSIGFSLYYIKLESAQYQEVARQCAERTSKIVMGSTKSAMLLNQKEKAFEIKIYFREHKLNRTRGRS